jgi:hypothetical protein
LLTISALLTSLSFVGALVTDVSHLKRVPGSCIG